MFIQSLIQAVAKSKFTFQIESSGDDIIFTVIPSTSAPECVGAIAKAHAALSVPLRVSVKSDNGVDEAILSDIQDYMQQRNNLISNLDVVNKVVADATRAIKQESKEKGAATDTTMKDDVGSNVSADNAEAQQPSKSRSLVL